MINFFKNPSVLSGVAHATMLIFLFNNYSGFELTKFVIVVILLFISTTLDFKAGFNAGKLALIQSNQSKKPKQSIHWDHKDPLEQVINDHPVCLFDMEFDVNDALRGTLKGGSIHLLRKDGHYTTLMLLHDGWVYGCDTSIGKDVLKDSCRYIPMVTIDAIELCEKAQDSLKRKLHN